MALARKRGGRVNPLTQHSATVAGPGPFYFAWGCFRDFVSRPCSALPKRRRTAPQPLLFKLDQLHPLQTRMPVLADDDGVVHGNAERCCNLDDRLGHVDIRLRRRRIAGGVVVLDSLETTYRIEKLIRTSPVNSDQGRQQGAVIGDCS